MEKKCIFRKGLAVGISILFIGLVFGPSISANFTKVTNDTEQVKISSKICGTESSIEQTIQVSKEDFIKLRNLVEEIENRINAAESKEKAIEIFNDAVISLNKYGLFPEGTDVSIIQKLLSNNIHVSNNNFFEKIGNPDIYNRFCLLSATTRYSDDINVPSVIGMIFMVLTIRLEMYNLLDMVIKIINYSQLKPIRVMNRIIIPDPFSISTFGLFGKKSDDIDVQPGYWVVIHGFTGIKLSLDDGKSHYIGYARYVEGPVPWDFNPFTGI